GGFARYDGRSGTIAAYVCGALRKICSGRENLGQVLGRRRTRREPDDEQHNQSGNSPGKREPDRRQVPLEFPPIDPNSSGEIERRDRADFAQAMLNELSPGDRELFIRHHMHDENVSALARKLGTTRRALDMRLHRAKEKLRERFKGFQW
ncbi:MAG: sigma factor-like helix-turn-helix DNA-binding protein, partial [Thermoguttaceae bacterium]